MPSRCSICTELHQTKGARDDEFAYAQDFFGTTPDLKSSVLTRTSRATLAPHVGVRGDIRYFHSFQDLNVLGFSVNNGKLDFGRAAAALSFTFRVAPAEQRGIMPHLFRRDAERLSACDAMCSSSAASP